MSPAKAPWLRRFHEGAPDGVRLVCFPHAAGSPSHFLRLSQDLSAALEVWGVRYPGRRDRRGVVRIRDVPELAEQLSAVVGTLGDRPLAFFGHGMGAVIAFEVARRLEGKGRPPVALFVSGRRAPADRRDEDAGGPVARLRSLSAVDDRLIENDAVRRLVLPDIRVDHRAVEVHGYRPRRPLRIPIVALVGDGDFRASREEIEDWVGHTAGGFSLHVMPGGHFFIKECRPEVARIVVDTLAQVVTKPRPHSGMLPWPPRRPGAAARASASRRRV